MNWKLQQIIDNLQEWRTPIQTQIIEYRKNTDGLKIQIPSTNMQSTKNTEWIQMDWKLRIIDKRQEWRSGQSLTFFPLVDLHIVLYCINALYFRHSLWWLCTRYFLHFVFHLIFCILWTVLYLCIVHWTFSVMTLQNVFRALCIYIFSGQFSHCYIVYLCSVHCIFLLFLRWVCASRLICCQDPPQVPKLPITTWKQRHLSSKYK